MTCDEYRKKFINEEMTAEEKEAFEKHLTVCEGCRKFVENYGKMKSLIKVRVDYTPSESLKGRVMGKIKKRRILKRAYTILAPTMAVMIIGTFLMFKPVGTNEGVYARLAAFGVEKLKSNTSSTATSVSSQVQTSGVNGDYGYMISMKYASDQF